MFYAKIVGVLLVLCLSGYIFDANASQNGLTNIPNSERYWKAYEIAVNQIHKWEGLRLLAYIDVKQCSIGYGFYWSKIPKNGKCTGAITQIEADSMLASSTKDRLQKVQKDFPDLSPEKQGILVSFAHNCPAGYTDMVRHGIERHALWCKTAGGKRLQGLVNRRAEESKILFSK